ncbi:RNA-dependent RNA polymerase [Fusarium virguliforme dsRNA mycovirus 1]|uniref:RNA-directed RNA polymerase n=1 Tax=Fusarium virguliforme dsRNA mycovirus 1 TaxID=1141583 RepID=H6UNN2_9VIRU|nr:RNA-dependent RNA polymerase [Fusarium virguliforme dsRNA mycovirus 1]
MLQYIFITPAPESVWDFLPYNLIELAQSDPILTSSAMKILDQLVPDSATSAAGKVYYDIYANNYNDEFSCATRLLTILGFNEFDGERFEDVNKVGMFRQPLLRLLTMSLQLGIVLRTEHENTETLGERDLTCSLIKDSIFYMSANEGWEAYPNKPAMVIVLFEDHIAFALRRDYLVRIQEAYLYRYLDDNGRTTTFKSVIERYPHVAGRAGGKVFITSEMLTTVPVTTGILSVLAARLHTVSQADLGWEQIFPINLILLKFLDIVGEDLLWALCDTHELWVSRQPEAAKLLKQMHAQIKTAHRIPRLSAYFGRNYMARDWARRLYGLEVLVGRTEQFELDFSKEAIMRTIDPVNRALPEIRTHLNGFKYISFSHTALQDMLPVATRKVFNQLLKDTAALTTLDEFYDTRNYWGASGGAPGAKITWENSQEKYRVNKRGALLALPKSRIRELLNSVRSKASKGIQPVQWSTKALKFEAGKLRSILNTTVEHYVIQGYITHVFETNIRTDSWYSVGHSNSARIANQLRRIADLKENVGFMWDYADFNINHAYYLISDLLLARIEAVLSRAREPSPARLQTVGADLNACAAFVILARYNTYLYDHDTDVAIRSMRGLQSGERDTSRVNSDANRVDTEIVQMLGKKILGYTLLKPHIDASGDDAFELTNSVSDAMYASALYNLSGSAGQVHKVSICRPTAGGAEGEFLRLHYDARTHSVSGYPIRAMVGFSHGEYFNEPVPQPAQRYAAFINQRAKLTRRGWSCPGPLFDAVVRKHTKLVYTDSGIRHIYTPNPRLVTLPSAMGGFGVEYDAKELVSGCSPPYEITWRTRKYTALFIPSGEGKTTLARQYPDLFIDHDTFVNDLILHPLRSEAFKSGDWKPVNAYLRNVIRIMIGDSGSILNGPFGPKVILTWGPDTIPQNITGVALLLKDLTGLRANVANRASILRSVPKQSIHYYKNFAERNSAAVALCGPTGEEVRVSYMKFEAPSVPPRYAIKGVDARGILRNTKTTLADYAVLNKYGVTETVALDREVVESSLSGAWPKQLMTDSLADYGRQLARWEKSGHFETSEMLITRVYVHYKLEAYVRHLVRFHLGIKSTSEGGGRPILENNKIGYPAAIPVKHHFNAIPSLVAPFALTTNVSFMLLLDHALKQLPNNHKSNFAALRKLLVDFTTPHQLTKRRASPVVQDHLNWITRFDSSNDDVQLFAYRWFKGDFFLLPPHATQYSSDFLTLARDITLVVVECAVRGELFRHLAGMPSIKAAFTIKVLELDVTNLIQMMLHEIIPGITLKD